MAATISNSLPAAATDLDAQDKTQDWTNGMTKAPKNVAWYQAALNRVPATAKEIFEGYSNIPEDEIIDHIHKVRDQAWEM